VLGGAAAVAVIAAGTALLATGAGGAADSELVAAAQPIRFADVYTSARDVRLGISRTYPEDRQLTGVRSRWAGWCTA
jgi:hypothetical protein